MSTKITLSIETDDIDLVERVGKAIYGDECDDQGCPAHYATPAQDQPTGVPTAMPEPEQPNAAAAFTPGPQGQEAEPEPQGQDVEADAEGLPWDSRIHTSNKGQKKDGTWKRKPGLSDEYYNSVVAELRNLMAVPGPAQQEAPAPAPAPEPEPEQPAQQPAAATPPPAPAPEPEPEQPAQPAGTADHSGMQFGELVRRITSENIDKQIVAQALQNAGLNSLPQLMQRKDLIPQVAGELFPGG